MRIKFIILTIFSLSVLFGQGSTWSSQTSGTSSNLWGAYFLNSTTGWVVGSSGAIYTTTDGGATWISQSYPTSCTTRSFNDVF